MSDALAIEFWVLIPGGYIARIPARLHATAEGKHPLWNQHIRYLITNHAEQFLRVMDIHIIISNRREPQSDDSF